MKEHRPLYQLWKRRWQRVGPPSPDFESLEKEGIRIANEEDHDTCVYELGIDPNDEEDEDEWILSGEDDEE